jgi:hypothetical protein
MPRHFSKMMKNPYFYTDHYKNETYAGKMEKRIENAFSKLKFKVFNIFRKKDNKHVL